MQQHRLVAVKRRIEPEPPFRRKSRLHLHVGDQETIAEAATYALLTDHSADWRARTVAGNDIVGVQPIRSFRRFHAERDAIALSLNADDLALPAQLEICERLRVLAQITFAIVLLQVDECGAAVA